MKVLKNILGSIMIAGLVVTGLASTGCDTGEETPEAFMEEQQQESTSEQDESQW